VGTTRLSAQSDKRAAVSAYLADSERSRLTNREIARRVGCGATLVNKLRKVHARGSEAPLEAQVRTPEPDRAPPRMPRKAFGAPPLNALHCWHDATPAERTKFVDAVGLWNLFNAAPEDHQAAFVARLSQSVRRLIEEQAKIVQRTTELIGRFRQRVARLEGHDKTD